MWLEIAALFLVENNLTLILNVENIVLGSESWDISLNLFTILVKYYIYTSRFNTSLPTLKGVIAMIKNSYQIEKISTSFYRSPGAREKFDSKWELIKNLVHI